MKLYWRKEFPDAWRHFFRDNQFCNGNAVYPESVTFMQNFHSRHIPIIEDTLVQWALCPDVSKEDITFARKCNERNDEVLIFTDANNA